MYFKVANLALLCAIHLFLSALQNVKIILEQNGKC